MVSRLLTLLGFLALVSLATVVRADPSVRGPLSEEQFNQIIDKTVAHFVPVADSFQSYFSISKLWDDPSFQAGSSKLGLRWVLVMFGGLARRPEMSEDAFALIICHEIGHIIGGAPFSPFSKMSVEGQADYFATATCAKVIWENEDAVNATFADKVPEEMKTECDQAYETVQERNLCYRSVVGILTMVETMKYLAKQRLGHEVVVDFLSPDLSEVEATIVRYPSTQCRLDTSLAGALCNKPVDPSIIGASDSEQEERYCSLTRDERFGRPRCWFMPVF
ncbi:MAG: hypothetical protein AB7T49_03765 [Oligoflexales bacterium]